MVVGLLGNESPDLNKFTLVNPKPENGVRLQATLGNHNLTDLSVGTVRIKDDTARTLAPDQEVSTKQEE